MGMEPYVSLDIETVSGNIKLEKQGMQRACPFCCIKITKISSTS